MSTTLARKTPAILIALLIGFQCGVIAASYVLLRYGYLVGFQRYNQTSPGSRRPPGRISLASFQPQQNSSAENQHPEAMPQSTAQTRQNRWIQDWALQPMPQTEPQTQPLSAAQPDPSLLAPHLEINEGDFVNYVVPPLELRATTAEVEELRQRNLLLPVNGMSKDELVDSYAEMRGTHVHEAIDILAPRNTPVVAVEDGSIARLWNSVPGGITIYQFDPVKKYEYYYAHLENYAEGLKEGDPVTRGQVIGYVGTSGNAPKNTPHLHFTIFKLTASKHWWEGTPVNSYLVFR